MGETISNLTGYEIDEVQSTVDTAVEKASELVTDLSNRWSVRIFAGINACLLARYVYIKIQRKRLRGPPGPVGIPFFGSFISMVSDEKGFFEYLRKHYGRISQFNTFWRNVIVIHHPVTAAEVWKNENALSRLQVNDSFWKIDEGRSYNLLADFYGPRYRKERKIVQTKFMLLLNSRMLRDCIGALFKDTLCPAMDKCIENNKPFFPRDYLRYVTFSCVFKVIFGIHLDMDNEDYLKWLECTRLRNIHTEPIFLGAFLEARSRTVGAYFAKILKPHVEGVFDVVSKYILATTGYEIHQTKGLNKFKGKEYIKYKENCAAKLFAADDAFALGKNPEWEDAVRYFSTLEEVFFAGYDTSFKHLEYSISVLAQHPDIQEKIYDELMEIYDGKEFTYEKYSETHLFRAFTWEGLRCASLIKYGVPRYTTAPIEVEGYVIPKNTVMFLDMKGINIHSDVWLGKGEFNLNNWLDENGKFRYNKHFLGLSIGKRNCPGKGVVERSYYCIYANLLMRYKLEYYNKNDKIEEQWALTNFLKKEIGLRLTRRKQLQSTY